MNKINKTKYLLSSYSSQIFSGAEQNMHTPFFVIEKMLKKIPNIHHKTFLVIYNPEIVFSLVFEFGVDPNNIIFFGDHSYKRDAVEICNLPHRNIKISSKLDQILLQHAGSKMKKFDVIVGNPPYKKNLHLDILATLSGRCDILTFIQPSNPFLDQKSKSIYTKKLDKIKLPLSSIDIVNSATAFPDADIQSLVCITYFDANHTSENIIYNNEITNISIQTASPDVFTGIKGYHDLHTMFFNLKDSLSIKSLKLKSKSKPKQNNYYVALPALRGNVGDNIKFYKDDFFTYYSNSKIKIQTSSQIDLNKNHNFEFETQQQAENFIDFLNTRFARTLLLLKKRDFHPKYCSTPIVDWNTKWTDQMLFSHFGLSQDVIDFILNNTFII